MCNKMDETCSHCTNWKKSDTERQILCDVTCGWNLKSQTHRNRKYSSGYQGLVGGRNGEMLVKGYKLPSSHSDQTRERNKRHPVGKEEVKLSSPGLLCARSFLITASISQAVFDLLRFSAYTHTHIKLCYYSCPITPPFFASTLYTPPTSIPPS